MSRRHAFSWKEICGIICGFVVAIPLLLLATHYIVIPEDDLHEHEVSGKEYTGSITNPDDVEYGVRIRVFWTPDAHHECEIKLTPLGPLVPLTPQDADYVQGHSIITGISKDAGNQNSNLDWTELYYSTGDLPVLTASYGRAVGGVWRDMETGPNDEAKNSPSNPAVQARIAQTIDDLNLAMKKVATDAHLTTHELWISENPKADLAYSKAHPNPQKK